VKRLTTEPVLHVPQGAQFTFGGVVGERLQANQENWLLQAPVANPAMLQMFRDRDRKPRRALLPWSGEFAGKYLISAVQGYRLTRDSRLKAFLATFVQDLIDVQDTDGYLGPHPQSERLTGKTHDGHNLWDLWGHYHCMLGLLLWYQETGDQSALDAASKAADLLCRTFIETGKRALHAGAEEMNLAISHIFCLLYEVTGQERYLRMAREIEKDWETPPAGDYVRTANQGLEFFATPKPRWESLPHIQAIVELYFLTGEAKYRQAAQHIWHSIKNYDRHNTGGFSSEEQAVGNPYDPRPIETCCVIAWQALSIDLLRMTGDSTIVDEVELTTFNALLGAQHPSGRWWTYNTPMDGVRRASAHDIVFQAHQGAPELNCCSVNAPRALGSLSEWAVMRTEDGIAVNFYGPCRICLGWENGAPGKNAESVTLTQTTDFPVSGKIELTLSLAQPRPFPLRLRIPAWSRDTQVSVNGEGVSEVRAGSYLVLEREWKEGDTILLALDMSLHIWAGQREQEGRVSLYRGPILLTYDQRFNPMDPDDVPALDAQHLSCTVEKSAGSLAPWVLLQFPTADGRGLTLCDFASAGATGTHYRSWLDWRGELPKDAASPFAVSL
jgi:uncharacterized protein